jgi:phosphoglycolate phosphatase
VKFKAVLFDLDGTLLNTIEDLTEAMNEVLRQKGWPEHDPERFKYYVGRGVKDIVTKALPPERRDEATIEASMRAYNEAYSRRYSRKTRPYDGVGALLDACATAGMPMAVLSNKPDEFTRRMVNELLPGRRFEVVWGTRPGVPHKPDPTSALEIAVRFKVRPEAVLYLGDSEVDMETAGRAGMYAVGVLWGFRTADELIGSGARILARRPTDLLDWLAEPSFAKGERG